LQLAEKHIEQVHRGRQQLQAPSGPPIVGAAVLLCALLAWLLAGLTVGQAGRWSTTAGVASTLGIGLLAGLLIGAATRATASGALRSRREVVARGAVALAIGAVVGELAALVLFAGSMDRRLDDRAARRAEAAPAVVQASADTNRARGARTALDDAVEQARGHRDEALVLARCEYNPSPACPQTRITGVPGAGPETRTANDVLADSQRELDDAVAARDRRTPGLDAKVADAEMALSQARQQAITDREHSLGARWVALHELTLASPAVLLLRLLTTAFCMLLFLLPLILRLWRRETTQDRRAAADAERERAELEADTAIAVKRAEVRAAAEMLWAEHQLAAARLAVEAQAEIDGAYHRRRVAKELESPAQPAFHLVEPVEPVNDDIYLPIAAEAEAASRAALLPAAPGLETDNLPASVGSDAASAQAVVHGRGATPTIPDVARAAARWIHPLVPTFVARAIDTTTQPLRAARQVFEEVEEIKFSLKRTRKVTVDVEESLRPWERSAGPEGRGDGPSVFEPVDADRTAPWPIDLEAQRPAAGGLAGRTNPALAEQDRPGELEAAKGPRQLPPGH
jgi:hypothetical protein